MKPRCASCLHAKAHTAHICRCWYPHPELPRVPLIVAHDDQCEHFEDRLTKESRAMLETRCPQE